MAFLIWVTTIVCVVNSYFILNGINLLGKTDSAYFIALFIFFVVYYVQLVIFMYWFIYGLGLKEEDLE